MRKIERLPFQYRKVFGTQRKQKKQGKMIPTDIHITHHFDLDGGALKELRQIIQSLQDILQKLDVEKHQRVI